MAIFHLTVKSVSRGKGQSAIAKAAYNAREALRDERTGELKDYSRSGGVVFSGIFAPPNAPAWSKNRAALWNAVERGEKRKDARLAQEIELALPHELTDAQRKWLVTDFAREQFSRKGIVADVNIHAPPREPVRPGDAPNHHAHILLTLREIGQEGFGKRLPECTPHQVERWREAWEHTVNRHLQRHGHAARIDRRSLEAQGIAREPTRHRGPTVDAMERRGIATDRGAIRGRRNVSRFALRPSCQRAAVALVKPRRVHHFTPPATFTVSSPARPLRARPMSRGELYAYYERLGQLEVFFGLFPSG